MKKQKSQYLETIRSQLFMTLHKNSFWCAAGIMFLYTIYAFVFFIIAYYKKDVITVYSSESFFAGRLDDTLKGQDILLNLFPILITLPFSFSYFEEKKSGVIHYLILRVGYRCYYISKMIVAFLVNFFIVTFSYLWNILLNWIVYPDTAMTINGDKAFTSFYNMLLKGDKLPKSVFYIKNPVAYLIFYTIFIGIVVGVLGMFSYAVSLFIKGFKVFIFLPLMILFYVMNHYSQYFGGLSINSLLLMGNGWKREFRYLAPAFIMGIFLLSILLVGIKCVHSKKVDDI